MARNMFRDGERDTEIFCVVVEARKHDGTLIKGVSEVNGPYPQRSTAEGQLTRQKKDMASRMEGHWGQVIASSDAWIEEGTITWKRVDEKH